MQDSFGELLKLLLPEIIVEYFELTSYKKAQVSIDIEHRNEEIRLAYFEKIVALKNILEEEFIPDLIFEKNYTLENGKTISRIWVEKTGVAVSNRSCWNEIFEFFNEKMNALELFYLEYDEFVKDIPL